MFLGKAPPLAPSLSLLSSPALEPGVLQRQEFKCQKAAKITTQQPPSVRTRD